MSIIKIKDVVKRYGSKIPVDHLSLKIEEGEIFGLLGPNGAGKSTMIKMICGLIKIDSGSIHVNRLGVHEVPMETKKLIGLVPQDLAIYDNLTAKENLNFFARLYGLRGTLLKDRVNEALEFVGLTDKQNDKPDTFSGGMKRRLNIACGIMHHPKVVIMDEPTVGIDPQSRNHILDAVRTLNKLGSTVIYTSHYMEEVEAISSRVGIMDHGRLIALGTRQELVSQMGQEEKIVIEAQFIHPQVIEELEQHIGIQDVRVSNETTVDILLKSSQTYLQDILFIFAKHEVAIRTLSRIEPNLESLFLTLTGRTLRD